MKIDAPGIYDISAEEYHADPCPTPSINASQVKVMAGETPLHVWTENPRMNPNFEDDDDGKFDIGSAAHSLMLRDVRAFAILDFDGFQSGAAKKARDAARADGKIPLLTKHWDRVNAMVDAGREQLNSAPDFSSVFRDGKPEQTLIWTEGEGPDLLWFRMRLDWLYDDRAHPYDDYKTTEVADPVKWSKTILYNVGHDISAAFYRRGIRALGLNRNPKMRFIIQEPKAPFCISGVELTGEILEYADREVEIGIRRWRWCRQNDRWPGYPAKFHRPEMPPWIESTRMGNEIRRDDESKAAQTDPDMLAASFNRQSPNPIFGDPI